MSEVNGNLSDILRRADAYLQSHPEAPTQFDGSSQVNSIIRRVSGTSVAEIDGLTELPDKCSILALDPLAALGGLDCDGIGIDELAVACVTGHAGIGHGHPLACGNAITDRLTISSADLC